MLQDYIDEFEYLKRAADTRVDWGNTMFGLRIPLATRVNGAPFHDGVYYTGHNNILIKDGTRLAGKDATSDNLHDAFRRFVRSDITLEEALRIANTAIRERVKGT